MTNLELIEKRRKVMKYGFIAFFANAVISIINPWWPQVAGIDLHFLLAGVILLLIVYSATTLSSCICSECGKRIFPFWARVTGASIISKPVTCPHCGLSLSKVA